MKRTVFLLIVGMLLLAGCTTAKSPLPSAPVAPSPEPTATLEAAHGADFVSAVFKKGERLALLEVSLRSGEPIGSAPFIALEAMNRIYPDARYLQLTYLMPSGHKPALTLPGPWKELKYDRIVWSWDAERETLTWGPIGGQSASNGGSGPVLGAASHMSTATVRAVAAGDEPVPAMDESADDF